MIFIDTSFFFAAFSSRDRRHAQALACLDAFKKEGRSTGFFLTTNHVVFETLALIRKKTSHQLTVTAGEELLSGQMAQIYQATPEDEKAAFEYLRKYADKEYSPIDCLSFVVMISHGISEALAFDRKDFSHRFVVLPQPQ